jgi:hypothetical protein
MDVVFLGRNQRNAGGNDATKGFAALFVRPRVTKVRRLPAEGTSYIFFGCGRPTFGASTTLAGKKWRDSPGWEDHSRFPFFFAESPELEASGFLTSAICGAPLLGCVREM